MSVMRSRMANSDLVKHVIGCMTDVKLLCNISTRLSYSHGGSDWQCLEGDRTGTCDELHAKEPWVR